MNDCRPVRVALNERNYDVLVGQGLVGQLGRLVASACKPHRAHLFEDEGLPPDVRDAVAASFEDVDLTRSSYRLSEASKSLNTLHCMLTELATAQLERTDAVVALGGGILGDVAGLAAGLHRRGVAVVQCPTTLLSMVDASVGGKTGVNLQAPIDGAGVLLKNAVGMFHQPSLVIADVDLLETLPQRERRCGLAECIKHGLIAGNDAGGLLHPDATEASMRAVLEGDWSSVAAYVRENVALKASIVVGDEREDAAGDRPGRRALNLGHTFAHAIEACAGARVRVDDALERPAHGEAVGLGLLAAARLAEQVLDQGEDLRSRIAAMLERVGLPTRLSEAPEPAELISAMRQDKKARSGRLRLVLPTTSGVTMVDDPGDSSLERAWRAVL